MSLKSAVKKTVEYASNFGGELTKEEAGERLLSSNIYKITNIKGNFKKK